MRQIMARYNAGRWLVDCPIHGAEGAVLACAYNGIDPSQSKFWTENNEYICPVCYPGIVAEFLAPRNGRIEKVPDRSARRTARLLAAAQDEIYQVVFPDEREQIEDVLKERPKLQRNWDGPHESISFLQAENKILRGIPSPRRRRKNGV